MKVLSDKWEEVPGLSRGIALFSLDLRVDLKIIARCEKYLWISKKFSILKITRSTTAVEPGDLKVKE